MKDLKEKMGLEVSQKATQALQKATKPNTLSGLNRRMIQDALAPLQAQIAAAIPKHLSGERMMQVIVNAIDRNPQIKECEITSVVGAIMQSSILGFKPTPELGQVYFVPYRDKRSGKSYLQMQIGYKGYIDLARRSGKIKMLYAEVVREGDSFEYEMGLYPKLTHKPSGSDTGKITHVYAVAHYNDGGYNFIVMSYNEIEKLRKRNPMQNAIPSMAWATDYAAMAKAKAIKQLAKYMPLSEEMQSAIISDEGIVDVKSGMTSFEDEIIYPEADEPSGYTGVDEKSGEVEQKDSNVEQKEDLQEQFEKFKNK